MSYARLHLAHKKPDKHNLSFYCIFLTTFELCMQKNVFTDDLNFSFFFSQTSFVVDEVSNIIKEAIESAIGGNAYQHSKVNQWTTSVVEQSLSQLTKLGKPFKYIVTCVIMQKNGAGLHTASSCFWDNSSDGTCTVRWENKTMYCIVSAFGLAI